MERPVVSVVIPTRDREVSLAAALRALAGQTVAKERFEVVVVRAGAAPEPAAAPEGLDVRFLEHRGVAGAAAQRNLGWRAARAALVAFLDDDCRPHPEWLQSLVAASEDDATVLQGRTEPDPAETHRLYGLSRSVRIRGPSPWFETCNIAYPRSLLERLGGFDERFPHAWAEDTDLGLRALESGARRAYIDRALAWHAVHPRSLRTALREAFERDSLPALIARHPGQRQALDLGLFARRAHTLVALALVGCIAFRRRPALAALFWNPYLFRHFDGSRGALRGAARVAVDLPSRLPVDLVEMAALARSSLRHRSLVL